MVWPVRSVRYFTSLALDWGEVGDTGETGDLGEVVPAVTGEAPPLIGEGAPPRWHSALLWLQPICWWLPKGGSRRGGGKASAHAGGGPGSWGGGP
mmetsp:Transcript_27489/g.86630  ORF Transcript_27489/g.86630 Transcript_27489/m.86630 type:complete len:95 (+) Transcript_27489:1190-1474(+)